MNNLETRRGFLKNSLLGVGSVSLISSAFGSTDLLQQRILTPSLPGMINARWNKRGVVLKPDQNWEHGSIQNFNSPAIPLGAGAWRVWYCVNPPAPYTPTIAYAEGVPGRQMNKFRAELTPGCPSNSILSIGNLPEGWSPVQPVYINLKNGQHRLYFWVHSSEQRVVRYLVAESDDGHRYEVLDPYRPVLYHFNDRAVEFVGTTPSGMILNEKQRFQRPSHEPPADPKLICNDATTVYQLRDGSFEMYTISLMSLDRDDPRWAPNDNLAGYVRVVDRLVSKDGLNWGGRITVLKPDRLMDPGDLQFYYLNVTHTDSGRIGMLGYYRVRDQTMDVERCFSADGIHWERPFRNVPWLERGWPSADPDTLGIYPASSITYHDGRWWLFYTGCNYTHNRKTATGDPQSLIMLANLY